MGSLGCLCDLSHSHSIKQSSMAITNFVLTVAGVSAVVLLLRSDVKKSASIFKQNVKHIRHWLEEEAPKVPKELQPKVPPKDIPKEDKH